MTATPALTKIGILGTGDVGCTLAQGFLSRGFSVKIGTREPDSERVHKILEDIGHHVTAGTFCETAEFGDIIILAVGGGVVMIVIELAGAESFRGKVVVDAVNPITYGENGLSLSMGFNTSMGEAIQHALPGAHTVKCFNTIGFASMINPRSVRGIRPDMFIAGNDPDAKLLVTSLIGYIGWDSVVDLGGIEESRLLEPMALMWIKLSVKRHARDHFLKVLC